MHKALFARGYLHKGTEVHQPCDSAVIVAARFRVVDDGVHNVHGPAALLKVNAGDEHMAVLLHVHGDLALGADLLYDFAACAEESFDCVMCGVCSARCPAGISHPQVAMLARRINGKYLAPKCGHLEDRVKEIENGDFQELLEALMGKPLAEMQELYNNREIEK